MANLKEHISLSKVSVNRPRYKKPGMGSKPPKRDNVLHGAKLSERLKKIRREFEKIKQGTPLGIEPVLVFTIKTDQRVEEADLERSGLIFLDEEADQQLVVLTKDGAAGLEERIEKYSQEVNGEENPRYNWLAALSGDMESRTPEQRTGIKLKKAGEIDSHKEYFLDVEFWASQDRKENEGRINKLYEYVEQHGGKVLDKYIGRSLCIARIKISGEFLLPLLEEPSIRVVDLPPQATSGLVQFLRTSLDEFVHPMPNPPNGAIGICIIDSGIMTAHPMLRNAIGYTRAFPSGDANDANGHGTMVAGVALYGDVKRCIENLNFEPPFYLFSARVLNAQNQFDSNQLIVTQMQDAIEYFHREYKCRVFNISIGDPDLVYDGGKPSAWSFMLDTLARELDIVIVVSAGNLPVASFKDEVGIEFYQNFPDYFMNGNREIRIIEPATAANVITVGSLAHSDKSYQLERYPKDLDFRPIAQIDDLSPFTRRGPGVNNAIKPDVCEYGGNGLWHDIRGFTRDIGLGIISTQREFTNSLFGTDIGTSLAAPKVTHLAASILQRYPKISANLVRALIANAAEIPQIAYTRFGNDDRLLNLYGYGKPTAEKAMYSDDNRVTLVAEDVIEIDEICLYEIPIPEEFQKLNGTRKITVSLAYDSPVRNRRDYLGIKMSFRLIRGADPAQIMDWHATRTLDAVPERIPDKHDCKMSPSSTRRETSTLQKAVFTAKRNQAFLDYSQHGGNFHLLVKCQKIWASADEFGKQRYGLAITIEHEDPVIQLYNLVEQRIQARERVRVRG